MLSRIELYRLTMACVVQKLLLGAQFSGVYWESQSV
jgi:hypothetical protein